VVTQNEAAADVLPGAVFQRNDLRSKTEHLASQKSVVATGLIYVKQAVNESLSTPATRTLEDASAEETFRNVLQIRRKLNSQWKESNNAAITQTQEVLRLQTLTESQSNLDLLKGRVAANMPDGGTGRRLGQDMATLMAIVVG
jgi:hypothetical protein